MPGSTGAAGQRPGGRRSGATGGAVASAGRPGALNAITSCRLRVDPDQDPYDIDGLQTLDRGCHISKTAAENRGEMMPGRKEWQDVVAELLQKVHII